MSVMNVEQVKEALREDGTILADSWVVARAQHELWQEAEARASALLGQLERVKAIAQDAASALADASVALDDDGSQRAASDAHQACLRIGEALAELQNAPSSSKDLELPADLRPEEER